MSSASALEKSILQVVKEGCPCLNYCFLAPVVSLVVVRAMLVLLALVVVLARQCFSFGGGLVNVGNALVFMEEVDMADGSGVVHAQAVIHKNVWMFRN